MPARARRAVPMLALVAMFVIAPEATGPRAATADEAPGSIRPALVAQVSPSRVRFVAGRGSSILVHGTYPKVPSPCVRPTQPVLHARYAGTIEVGRDTDGSLFLIGILPFEDYLEGIAEVPRIWPMASLKAQVVAARTYALARMNRPTEEGLRLGYQLCATDQCQVYRGLGIAEGPNGYRWRKAVRATRGEALLHGGRPADTLYFSTSNGRTYGNEDVFGSDPLPYLRPREERDDGASPVSRWRATISHADVARFLRAAGHWSDAPVTSVVREGDTMVIRGAGRTERIAVTEFRIHMNSWAPCLDPDRYPGGLPQTVPSKWFGAENAGGSVVLRGRGWGHGVGMVQWGAYGKAVRGQSYREILAFYYGGLTPQKVATPGEIQVGIAVGLRALRVEGVGRVAVEGRLAGEGPWLVTGGEGLRLKRSSPVPRFIEPGTLLSAPDRARAGRTVRARLLVPALSVARLALNVGGEEIPLGPWRTVPAGEAVVRGTIPEVPSGGYVLRAQVSNGIDIVSTEPHQLLVAGIAVTPAPTPSPTPTPSPASPTPMPTPSSPRAAPTEPDGGTRPLWPAAGAASAVVAVLLALALRRRAPRR